MDKQTAKQITDQLRVLFSAFPPAQRSDEAMVARTYLTVLDGFRAEAIERSVQQFIRGLVPTHDGRFAPELARNVKQWDEAISVREDASKPLELASGIMTVDFGHGPIDMTRLSLAEQDAVLRTGRAPDMRLGSGIKARLQRVGDPEGDRDVA